MKESITIRSMIDSKVFWDFSNFNAYRLSKRPLALLVAFPVFMIGMGIFNLATTGNTSDGLWLGGAFILVGLAYPISYMLYYRSSIRKQIQKFGLEKAQNFYTCTLDETGLHVANETETAECPWDRMHCAYWVDGYVYLFATRARSFILPVKDIENATEEDLLALLRAHLPAAKVVDKRRNKTAVAQ